jgi:hypothetical protein
MKPRLLLVLAAALLAVIAAVIWLRPRPAPAPPRPPPAPMSFVQSTAAAKVELKLDPAIARDPGLRSRLFDDGMRELKGFAAQAVEDQQRLKAAGLPIRPYQRSVSWTLTAATPVLASARQDWFDDTGGAHPNHGFAVFLWDPMGQREVLRSDLFKPDADEGRLDQALCQAIRVEKAKRQGAVIDPKTWPCPKWADSNFVLTPSNVPGKAAGLTFLFDPYALGPYVEGDYSVPVPTAAFRSELVPAYAAAFVQ